MPPGAVAQQGVAECTPAQVNTAAARPPLIILLLVLPLRLCWGLMGVRRPGLRERYLDSSPAVQLIKTPEAMPGSPFVVLGPDASPCTLSFLSAGRVCISFVSGDRFLPTSVSVSSADTIWTIEG